MNELVKKTKELVIEYQNGNEKVVKDIIDIYYPFIKKFTETYNLYNLEVEDLYQEGLYGLSKAIKTCDVSEDSFDMYIKKVIARQIYRKTIALNTNRNLSENYSKIYLKYVAIKNKTNLTDKEISKRIGISEEKLSNIINTIKITNNNLDYNINYNIEDCIDKVSNEQIISIIDNFSIDEKSKEVLYLKYGLIDNRCWSLDELTTKYGVTRSRIYQIVYRNLKYIRKQLYNMNDCYLNNLFTDNIIKNIEQTFFDEININYSNSFYEAFCRFEKEDLDYVINNLISPSQKLTIIKVYGPNLDKFDKNSKYKNELYRILQIVENRLIDVYLSKKSNRCVIFNKKQLEIVLNKLKKMNIRAYSNVYKKMTEQTYKNDEFYIELSKIIFDEKNKIYDYSKTMGDFKWKK